MNPPVHGSLHALGRHSRWHGKHGTAFVDYESIRDLMSRLSDMIRIATFNWQTRYTNDRLEALRTLSYQAD